MFSYYVTDGVDVDGILQRSSFRLFECTVKRKFEETEAGLLKIKTTTNIA